VETPEQVESPLLQITLEDARRADPKLEIGGELRIPKVTEGILGRIAAQFGKAGDLPESTRSGARHGLQRVHRPRRRSCERDGEAGGRSGRDLRTSAKRKRACRAKEQSRLESFAIGERVRVVIARVERASKGPGVVVSRAVRI